METWWIGLAWNATIAAAYIGIGTLIGIGVIRTGQVRANPLALATFLMFAGCGMGHLVHTVQLLGFQTYTAASVSGAARIEYSYPHMWLIDGVTASVGVWYWTMRQKFPHLVRGAAIFEDMDARRRRALEIHDNIVQGLVQAKLALELNMNDEGHDAVDQTLGRAKHIITQLLGEQHDEVQPGDLRRKHGSSKDLAPNPAEAPGGGH